MATDWELIREWIAKARQLRTMCCEGPYGSEVDAREQLKVAGKLINTILPRTLAALEEALDVYALMQRMELTPDDTHLHRILVRLIGEKETKP